MTPEEMFPEWFAKKAREKAAGEYTCVCGNVYCLTTNTTFPVR